MNALITGMLLKRESVPVKVKKLFPDSKIPTSENAGNAGYDLYVHRVEDYGNYLKVYSGISIEPKVGVYMMLVPRSSAHKLGLTLYNNLGIIDNSYRGEIIAVFLKTENFKDLPEIGSRLTQLIPQKQIWLDIEEVDNLSDTQRGVGGFGSTGK